MTWLIVIGYLACGLATGVAVARWALAEDGWEFGDPIGAEEIVFPVTLGLCMVAFWPVLVVGYGFWCIVKATLTNDSRPPARPQAHAKDNHA